MLAFPLMQVMKKKVKRSWAFSNMVTIIRHSLMYYIDIYKFLEDPEGEWRLCMEEIDAEPTLWDIIED